jgi:indolepyruvate ferredoxin oxidoreductase alpha subunit
VKNEEGIPLSGSKKRILLSGDEAVARAAYDCGACGTSYPGTPATEIQQALIPLYAKEEDSYKIARWDINEKVAMERALGLCYAGRRALVSFKHVGLNVASDAFMSSSIIGPKGLVIAVADDPGMHSSQNEQDSRFYADFSGCLCLEPSNSQEAYDMTRDAFELSEELEIPVMVRLVTRLSHVRAPVVLGDRAEGVYQRPVTHEPQKWTLLPAFARVGYSKLVNEKQPRLEQFAGESRYNHLELRGKELGIIACGNGFNYALEREDESFSYLKIGTYPLPVEKIRKLVSFVDKVLVVEEGYPFVERLLPYVLQDNGKISGKFDGSVKRLGELSPDAIGIGAKIEETPPVAPQKVPGRPPALCRGCPHSDTYDALGDAVGDHDAFYFGDIGCYTLGALSPHYKMESCVDMGGSIGLALGAADAGLDNVVAIIGDSTFTHSGLPALYEAAYYNLPLTVLILDNTTTAMTGAQPTMSPDETLERTVKGLGVAPEHVRTILPLRKHREENAAVMKEELAYHGTSVIIARRECLEM